MADHSSIEWTDATWNPVRGCTKISPGCKHCYAETFAERFRGVPGHPCEQGFDLKLIPGKLGEPLRWSKSRMIFVNSMSDLFHEDVPDDYILSVANVMQAAHWHTYQVLTKSADRLQAALRTLLDEQAVLPHIWWGVSAEDREHGLPRVDLLREAPAAVRFLSVEPLLEDLGRIDLNGIHWVIVGGESGHGARPMQSAWVESIREQCAAGGRRRKRAGCSMAARMTSGQGGDNSGGFASKVVNVAVERPAPPGQAGRIEQKRKWREASLTCETGRSVKIKQRIFLELGPPPRFAR